MKDTVIFILIATLSVFGMYSCSTSEWYNAKTKQDAAEQKAKETPHVIREVDGCKVYAFFSGDRYHYFTRCKDSTTSTESSYNQNCGKGCTKVVTEVINETK